MTLSINCIIIRIKQFLRRGLLIHCDRFALIKARTRTRKTLFSSLCLSLIGPHQKHLISFSSGCDESAHTIISYRYPSPAPFDRCSFHRTHRAHLGSLLFFSLLGVSVSPHVVGRVVYHRASSRFDCKLNTDREGSTIR